jgi:hypothetical protein
LTGELASLVNGTDKLLLAALDPICGDEQSSRRRAPVGVKQHLDRKIPHGRLRLAAALLDN